MGEEKIKDYHNKTEKKRASEKKIVAQMVTIYCHGKRHERTGTLCEDCQKLLEYANTRIEHCPFMESKTFCAHCKVHCYKPAMREQIRQVMAYAGPRMLLHHPAMTIYHALTGLQGRLLKKEK